MIGQIFIQRTKEQQQPHHLGPTAKTERFWTLKTHDETRDRYNFKSDNNNEISLRAGFNIVGKYRDPLYASVLEPSSSFNFPLKNYHGAKAWMQAFHRKLGHPVPLTTRELYNYWFKHWGEIDYADDMFEEDSWDEIREAYRPIDIQDAVKRGWLFLYETSGSEITDFDDIEDDAAVEIHFHGETMAQNIYLLDVNEEERETVCDIWGCEDEMNDPIAARSLASRGSTPPPKRKRPSTPDAPRKVKQCILIDTKCV